MTSTHRLAAPFFAVLLLLTSIHPAQASLLTVNSGDFCCVSTTGAGGGRAQGILADSTFQIQSLAIFGDLISQSFDVNIHASTTGSDVGSVLETSSAVVGGTGNGWNEIAINFEFLAGNFYVINWRPSDLGISDWSTSLDFYFDRALPVTVGPLTLLDGLQGSNAEEAANTLHPNFRYDTGSVSVPEPGMIALFGLGLAGLGFGMRRR